MKTEARLKIQMAAERERESGSLEEKNSFFRVIYQNIKNNIRTDITYMSG